MAGSDPRFDPSKFRESIKFVMRMADPTNVTETVSFRWNPEKTYSQEDGGHKPFSWTASPATDLEIADLIVDCVVDFAGQNAGGGRQAPAGTSVGEFDTVHGIVTLLDVDWEALMTHSGNRVPDLVIIDTDTYQVTFKGPPNGLFDVTVYELHIESLDEH